MAVKRGSTSPPYCARWLDLLRWAIKQRGGDVDAANHLHAWVSSNPDFECITYREHYLPVIPPRRSPEEAAGLQGTDEAMRGIVAVITT